MNPAILILTGFVAGSVLTYGLQANHYDRCRRILSLATTRHQTARTARRSARLCLDLAATEHSEARRAEIEACRLLSRAESLERQVFVASVN